MMIYFFWREQTVESINDALNASKNGLRGKDFGVRIFLAEVDPSFMLSPKTGRGYRWRGKYSAGLSFPFRHQSLDDVRGFVNLSSDLIHKTTQQAFKIYLQI